MFRLQDHGLEPASLKLSEDGSGIRATSVRRTNPLAARDNDRDDAAANIDDGYLMTDGAEEQDGEPNKSGGGGANPYANPYTVFKDLVGQSR